MWLIQDLSCIKDKQYPRNPLKVSKKYAVIYCESILIKIPAYLDTKSRDFKFAKWWT